ncbi:MAG: hypothetical protein V3T75_02300, partial [candidate division Zixibacteria bacterium]
MSSQNRTFTIIFLATVIIRIAFYLLSGFTADDALITFRYAENIIAGHGFVYNIGEKVLGTTTPLFTFLISLLMLLKLTAHSAALLISLICSGLTSIILYRFARRLRFGKFSLLPLLIYILWPRSIVADSSGMETALFSLLIIAAFYFQFRKMRIYSSALATLTTLTRPEGALLLALLLAINCYEDRRYIAAYFIIPLSILIPWLAFSYFYFGSIVPGSITGKLALYSFIETRTIWEKLIYILGWHNPLGWLLFLAALFGSWWLLAKQNFGRLEIIWLSGMIAFFTLSKTALFFWYPVPLYPVYLLLATASMPLLWDKFFAGSKFYRPLIFGIWALICLTLGYYGFRQLRYYQEDGQYLTTVHQSIGLYLKNNAEPEAVVAARYIGNTGYYSNL